MDNKDRIYDIHIKRIKRAIKIGKTASLCSSLLLFCGFILLILVQDIKLLLVPFIGGAIQIILGFIYTLYYKNILNFEMKNMK